MKGPASELAARLLGAATREGVMQVFPFWADGGSGSGAGNATFVPPGHVLAAYPSAVHRAWLADLGPGGLDELMRRHLPPPSAAAVPLVVMLLGYDAGRAIRGHESLFALPGRAAAHAHDALPDVLIAIYDGYLEAADEAGPWTAVGDTTRLERALDGPAPDADARIERRAAELVRALHPLVDRQSAASYLRGFEGVMAGVEAGDYYQVNLARRLEAELPGSAEAARTGAPDRSREALLATAAHRLHLALREAQSAAFGAWMPIDEGAWVVSGSPECLLKWRSDIRLAQSFPIKGTLARSSEHAEDAQLGSALRTSAKDVAEHVMIVDLVRNDLGRVAVPGSVEVRAIFSELKLATVRHLVSEVRAVVSESYDLADLIASLFPGGSITGAPKIAAMRALDVWESFKRNYYCGSLGVIRGGREATFSILIRTALLSAHGLSYGSGGGLVADSQAAAELAETELKALAINSAIASTRAPSEPGPR